MQFPRRIRRVPCQSRRLIFAALMGCLSTPGAVSQLTTKISSVAPDEAVAGAPITVTVELRQGETIEQVFLLARTYGETEYQRFEMDLRGNTASVTLPSRLMIPPFLEYYLVLVDRSGGREAYPLNERADPFTAPPSKTLQLPVRLHADEESQIVFLSPEASSILQSEEVVVAVSLLRADSLVVRNATQLFLDGANVTDRSVLSGDLMVFVPANHEITLSPGAHRINVRLYSRNGNLYRAASLTFSIWAENAYAGAAELSSQVRYGGSVQLESRQERVQNVSTWYNRAGLQFSGRSGEWRLLTNAFLTSEESPSRQPQDRFFVGVESPIIRAGYGDAFPTFPNLILSGMRVRGLHSSVQLGSFGLSLALGSTMRAIDGRLLAQFAADSLTAEMQRDPGAAFAPISGQTWGKFSYGTFSRNVFAIRPSIGSGETWQLGLTWLSSKDDPGSIHYGIRPQENIVLGTDFVSRLDDNRIEFSMQGAFSAYNSDISSGNFNDAYIDSVYPNSASTIKTVRGLLKPFITVNENLRPLSFRHPATVAADAGVRLNYFDHNLRFSYLYRGSDYTSFGQTFLRKDIQGFNILDRVRLLQNEVFASLGFEHLSDNTGNLKVATTHYNSLNAALSYFSRADLPTITLGYNRFVNANGLTASGSDSANVVDDATNRFFLQSSYEFEFLARHAATLNVSSSNKKDSSPRHLDVDNLTVSLGLHSRFPFDLETLLDVSINGNTLPADTLGGTHQTLNYTMLSIGGKYGIVPDVLNATATVGPTFGDFKRNVFDVGLEWYALQTLVITVQFNYFTNEGLPSDNFLSARLRYDL
jgi:hypothetical protein